MHKHNTEHITDLKHLWHAVFGDAPSIIDAYFDTFYSPGLTAAEYVNGELAAAAYVMPAGELVYNQHREKCAHIYAVAVYEKFRGRGLGISVTNRAVELAKKQGYTAVILHPAEESLFGYYEKHCGFTTCFSAQEKCVTLPSFANRLSEADIDTYIARREALLKNTAHVALNREILRFFQKCGGRLYVFEGGCAASETADGVTYFREYLSDGTSGSLSAMAGSQNCHIATPGDGFSTGMIHGKSPFTGGWLGLTLE